MPQLGETVAEGKITVWFKTVGDAVAPGDNLFEIETDKVSMEVPATEAGVISEIRVSAGETAPVGAVVAVIGDAEAARLEPPVRKAAVSVGEGLKPAPTSAQAVRQTPFAPAKVGVQSQKALGPRFRGDERIEDRKAPLPQVADAPLDPFMAVRTPERNYGPARIAGGAHVTPLARRLAAEGGIDITHLKGSGPHGRIVARDIAAAASAGDTRTASPVAATGGMTAAQVRALYADTPYEEIPLDNMRRTIARRMVDAKQTVPHFYLMIDVGLDAVLKLREEANAGAAKSVDGDPAFRLSVNDFVIKALALALQRVPAANAVWAEDRILRFTQSDIGVAVALDGGLLTPVIRGAESKALSVISNEMRELAARARERKLKPVEYQGGAAAISNLGMYGVREFSAIINPPQSSILAVGAGQRRPTEGPDGAVVFATQMTATLSCDHRVVDGALGAELLAEFKALIETPVRMLV
jgi:pyruvate dehydrogenase E2 component (dihydrolipoamide acetyltransferase)